MNEKSTAASSEKVDLFISIAAELSDSKLSYFAVVNEDETELIMLGWSKTAMEECKVVDKPITYPLETTGLWGDCVRQRQPVITNNYQTCQKETKKGYPEGHVKVVHHMNVPIWSDSRIVGVLGVGNKETPYTQDDADNLCEYAQAVWLAVRP
jgi:GAF domain-containing protein